MATKPTIGTKKMGTSAKVPKFDNNLFETGVIGALKTADRGIDDNSDNTTCMIAMNEAIELFQIDREYKPIEEFGSAVMALQAFGEWLETSNYSYKAPVYHVVKGFTVQISVPNGAPNSLSTFQLHCELMNEADLAKGIDAAYKELMNVIQSNYKPAPSKSAPTKHDKEIDENVSFDALRREVFQGKAVYRLIPTEGRWVQHGVALYADEARKAGINLSEYEEEGDYELQGSGDIEYKPDGKPMRWARITLE